MYSVIQFSAKDGGTVSLVNNRWFTPRRCEVFWPPVKGSKAFDRVLAEAKTPDHKWKLYSVERVFCETDDIEKAKKKLKLVEDTSDLQTEAETEPSLKRKRVKRYVSSSEEENDTHLRPPPLKKKTFNKVQSCQAAGSVWAEAYYGDKPESNAHDTLQEDDDSIPLLTDSILQGLCDEAEVNPGLNVSSAAILATPVRRERIGAAETPRSNFEGVDAESTCLGGGTTGFQDKVLSLLAMIKTQNDQLLGLLRESKLRVALKPQFQFPMKTFEELDAIETLLKNPENYENLVTFIESIGGSNTSNNVSRAMKLVLADSLAKEFNFYGKRSQKKPFCQLLIRNCIVESMKKATGATIKEIEDHIKIWLKHAPERLKKASK